MIFLFIFATMEVVEVPQVFQKLELQTRSNISHYKDLSRHLFTGHEKYFLCSKIIENLANRVQKVTLAGVCESSAFPDGQ